MILWSGTILASEVSYKKLIPINKAIRAGNVTDFTQAFAGYKSNLEVSQQGATFIGFRCLAAPCATIPFRYMTLKYFQKRLQYAFNGNYLHFILNQKLVFVY